MVKRLTLFGLFLTSLSAVLYASKVDTVGVFSGSMQKEIKTVVIFPDTYRPEKEFPVLYLLHGYGDNHGGWANKAPVVAQLADLYEMIIVCPDGNYNSWYWDSPVMPENKLETFVSRELVHWVDKNFNTVKSRAGRAITGLSMGGHGAFYLAFRHQDVYGACGSMSGGVDIRPFPDNWDMAKSLGVQSQYPERWEQYTVMGLLHLLTPNRLKIIFDCGSEDFFYHVNVRLHEELTYRKIPHDFISRPGAHNWEYWQNAVQYQTLFFSNFFKAGAKAQSKK